MAHPLRQRIVSSWIGVRTHPPQRIAASTPASSSLQAPTTGVVLNCFATMFMNDPGSVSAQDK